jgi:uncharacterized protein YbjT (DUF2867 family)
MRVAVAGGTGLVGRYVVATLSEAGHDPVTLARSVGVDITNGNGLDAALAGVQALIDVSNVTTMKKGESIAFFEAGTRNLLDAGERAGVQHHVILSIVGIDRVDFGYYFGKRRQEELALGGGRPVSVLRSTQFHEFAGQMLDRARGPVALVPRMAVAPVAAREVATALVRLVEQGPAGLAPELGGPQRRELPELARAVLSARGRRRLLVPVRLPGAAGRAMAAGALLPAGDAVLGSQTFDDWLASPSSALR